MKEEESDVKIERRRKRQQRVGEENSESHESHGKVGMRIAGELEEREMN